MLRHGFSISSKPARSSLLRRCAGLHLAPRASFRPGRVRIARKLDGKPLATSCRLPNGHIRTKAEYHRSSFTNDPMSPRTFAEPTLVEDRILALFSIFSPFHTTGRSGNAASTRFWRGHRRAAWPIHLSVKPTIQPCANSRMPTKLPDFEEACCLERRILRICPEWSAVIALATPLPVLPGISAGRSWNLFH